MLNLEKIKKALKLSGRNQAQLAAEAGVSRAIVSKWLKGEKFPRPALLLKLANILSLSFDDMVLRDGEIIEPIVAFRKKGQHKIKPEYIENAKDMGRLLMKLVPYLPFEELTRPSTLKKPVNEYNYIQKVTETIRGRINSKKGALDPAIIEIQDLIHFFNKLNAVIIPVLWGDKQNHENALHIYLPDSMTTWIYLNLDCKLLDFKFWMAHELGHVLAPQLTENEAEDFADAFAGALLFPHDMASALYAELHKSSRKHAYRTARFFNETAERLQISPITIYKEINKFAKADGKKPLDLERDSEIYKTTTTLNKEFPATGALIFKAERVSPAEYIAKTESFFRTPFFEAVKQYIQENETSAGFLQNILNVSFVDAQSIYAELC